MRERCDRFGVTTPVASDSSSSKAAGPNEVRSDEPLFDLKAGRFRVDSTKAQVSLDGGLKFDVRHLLSKALHMGDLPSTSSPSVLAGDASSSSCPILQGTLRPEKAFFMVSSSQLVNKSLGREGCFCNMFIRQLFQKLGRVFSSIAELEFTCNLRAIAVVSWHTDPIHNRHLLIHIQIISRDSRSQCKFDPSMMRMGLVIVCAPHLFCERFYTPCNQALGADLKLIC